jgi:LPS export ABC transporter protein LptC
VTRYLSAAVLLGVVLLPLTACRRPRAPVAVDQPPPFVFRSLDLKQQDPSGRPAWQLTSPEARYDLRRRLARADKPRGLIYAKGQPLYRLQADSGTVIGDGQAILLEGNLRVERLSKPEVFIRADRARWLPKQQLLLVDRHPEAYDQQGRLRADRARFRLDADTLELIGAPRLDRWAQRFNPIAALPVGPPETTVQVASLSWQPGTGALVAAGPVVGERSGVGQPVGGKPQKLLAERLEGNTQRQTFSLLGAVQWEDPARGQRFEGRDLQLDLSAQSGTTSLPFQLSDGSRRATGTGLTVQVPAAVATIANQCHLQQPGDQLDAGRCQWNWRSGVVSAEGSVVLQRAANRQTSRATVLQGNLGEGGSFSISAPGSRVISRFQVSGPPR